MNARTQGSEVVYPCSDGTPVGETGLHAQGMLHLLGRLIERFTSSPTVYVGGNQFLYYVEGDPTQVVCPDIYVRLDRPNRPLRDTWKVWEEGGPPTFILELVSPSSRTADLVTKRALYERLGVREYAVFDPRREVLDPPMRLWRAVEGVYVEVLRGPFGWWSDVVGRWLDVDAGLSWKVVLRHPDGAADPTDAERAEAESARAEAESARAEAESARAEAESARAEAESARAEAEAARAEAEAARADAAVAERNALLDELRRLRGEPRRPS